MESAADSMLSPGQRWMPNALGSVHDSSGHLVAAHGADSNCGWQAQAAMTTLAPVPDLERASMDSTTASSSSSAESESMPQGPERPEREGDGLVLHAILRKAARAAVLPAALSAYVPIGQQRSLHLPPPAAHQSHSSHAFGQLSNSLSPMRVDSTSRAIAHEPQRAMTGSIFWRHR